MEKTSSLAVLGMMEPFTGRELKKAFRAKSLIAHPDAGGTKGEFLELQDAYNVLLKFAQRLEGLPEMTEDHYPMDVLGKGFSLSEAAKGCADCSGYGYKKYTRQSGDLVEAECPSCGGLGAFSYPCKRCGGTGKFKDPRTGKAIGDCDGCRGTGRFVPAPKEGTWYFNELKDGRKGYWCKECGGDGVVMVSADENERYYYLRCDTCKGIGEIKIFNPVLPRGLFAAVKGA